MRRRNWNQHAGPARICARGRLRVRAITLGLLVVLAISGQPAAAEDLLDSGVPTRNILTSPAVPEVDTPAALELEAEQTVIDLARGRLDEAIASAAARGEDDLEETLQVQRRKLDFSARFVAGVQINRDGVPGRAALASVALGGQASVMGLDLSAVTPDVPAHGSPSKAALALLARHGVEPSEAERADLTTLDDSNETSANALTAVIDAFIAFEDVGRAYEEGLSRYGPMPELGPEGDEPLSSERLREYEGWATKVSGDAELRALLAKLFAARQHLLGTATTFATVGVQGVATSGGALSSESGGGLTLGRTGPLPGPVQVGTVLSIDLNADANEYTTNFSLLIDVGGDDVYRNNAGGARSASGETAGALIDLTGDDEYLPTRSSGTTGGSSGTAQGFLFDGAGHDRYVGENGGADGGTGFLFDAAGDDEYGTSSSTSQNGGANGLGAGHLFDAAGDDRYQGGDEAVNGAAAFQGGSGFLVDVAGSDRYVAVNSPSFRGQSANGGAKHGGAGFLLDIGGGDVYTADMCGVNGGAASGYNACDLADANGRGNGFLFDVSGRDRYEAEGAGANGGVSGLLAGAGMLLDGGGHDSYTAGYSSGELGVNGGSEGGVAGLGLLLDGAGNDDYRDHQGGSGTNETVVPKGNVGAQIDASVNPVLLGAFSDDTGLEDFYGYEPVAVGGSGQGYVNVANGNLVLQHTDLSVPGRGLKLRLTRAYNASRDHLNSVLGKGWSLGVSDGEGMLDTVVDSVLSLDVMRIVETFGHEDQFDFYDGDGTRHHFVKGGAEGVLEWHTPPGLNLTLSEHDDSGTRVMRFTRPDGVVYEFRPFGAAPNTDYRLNAISDRNGNTMSFTYTSDKLTRITDPEGRTLDLAYSGAYLSSSTYTAKGITRQTSYTVDANARLVSVTEAVGTGSARTTAYAYAAYGLSSITDPRGNATAFDYDLTGRVASTTDRTGQTSTVGYGEAECPSIPQTPSGSLTCFEDPLGNTTTWATSGLGNPLARMDAGDDAGGGLRRNVKRWSWGQNRLLDAIDETGDSTQYSYNTYGQIIETRLSSAGGEADYVTGLTYVDRGGGVADLAAVVAGVGTPDPRVWVFDHDAGGKLLKVTNPEGGETSFTYHTAARLKSVTDPRGKTTNYGDTAAADKGYDISGQPKKITDPLGKVMTISYDFLGLPLDTVDRKANTWQREWDRLGRPVKEIDSLGADTWHCYDNNGNEVLTVGPGASSPSCSLDGTGGHSVRRTFDAKDQLATTLSASDGQIRKHQYVYDDATRLVAVREPRSFSTSNTSFTVVGAEQKASYVLFPNARLQAFVDEDGHRTDFTYTPDGNISTILAPSNGTARRATTYTYNHRGQVKSDLVSGHSKPTVHAYSAHGERLKTTDPKGQTTTFAYDPMGRPVRVVDAAGLVTSFTYDPAGNLLTLTRPTGTRGSMTATYTYTDRNEIASETDPSEANHSITYEYDDEGRQTHRKDRWSGTVERTVEHTYDNAGRLTARTATIAGETARTHAATYGYAANGTLTSASATLGGSNVASITAAYTTAGELMTWTETIYNTAGSGTTKASSYTYAADGILASRTVDGQTSSYEYALNGRETKTSPGFGPSGDFVTSHHPSGAPAQTTAPNGAATSYTFDPAGRLIDMSVTAGSSTLSSWTGVAYDDNDNRISEAVTRTEPNGTTRTGNATLGYDRLDRLVSAKQPFESKALSYALDDAGNITHETGDDKASTSYTYANNRLASSRTQATETPEPDLSVNVDTNATFSYDHFGNLERQEVRATAVATSGGLSVEETETNVRTITYDAALHTRRVSESSDGSYVEYAYDAFDRLVRRFEHPASGSDTTELYFHDAGSNAQTLGTDGSGTVTTRYVLDSAGVALAQHDYASSTGRGYFVTDARGDLAQLLDHSAGVKAVYSYDPFGKPRPGLDASVGSWDSRLRYQTAPRDPKTGAYALGPRMYDPEINRFVGVDHYAAAAANLALQIDPLTGNLYMYAGANPANLIDDGHGPGCGRYASEGTQEWENCKNDWMRIKRARQASGACGECPEAYGEFNTKHPGYGLGPKPTSASGAPAPAPGPSAEDLAAQARAEAEAQRLLERLRLLGRLQGAAKRASSGASSFACMSFNVAGGVSAIGGIGGFFVKAVSGPWVQGGLFILGGISVLGSYKTGCLG